MILNTDVKLPHPGADMRHAIAAAYYIKNDKSDKIYVGSTGNLYHRIKKHEYFLKKGTHPNCNLQELFANGATFSISFIISEDRQDAIRMEQLILDYFQSSGFLLNVSKDALHSMKSRKHSAETIKKMSLAKKGKRFNLDHRHKLSLAKLGRPAAKNQLDSLSLGRLARMKSVVIDGNEYSSVTEAAKALGIHQETVRRKLKNSNNLNWFYK